MELSRRETVALFEGLMEAELRKMRRMYPRCRIERDLGEEEIYYTVRIGKRRFTLFVGASIELTLISMRNKHEYEDYTCDGATTCYTDEEAAHCKELLQSYYFPLLEKPHIPCNQLFPEGWETD